LHIYKTTYSHPSVVFMSIKLHKNNGVLAVGFKHFSRFLNSYNRNTGTNTASCKHWLCG